MSKPLPLAIGCALVVITLLFVLLDSGCATVPTCTAGTYLSRVDTDEGATGEVAVTVATQGGKAGGGLTRSVDWTCRPLCRKGTFWGGTRGCVVLPSP